MKKLLLSKEETRQLNKNGAVEISRNGFDILVEKNAEWEDGEYTITIINPYDEIKLAKEEKVEEKQVEVCDWYGHIHPYDVKTTGKHPVHMIDGGNYLTESEEDFGSGDMGWFFVNEKDYQWFKNHLISKKYEELI